MGKVHEYIGTQAGDTYGSDSNIAWSLEVEIDALDMTAVEAEIKWVELDAYERERIYGSGDADGCRSPLNMAWNERSAGVRTRIYPRGSQSSRMPPSSRRTKPKSRYK